MKRFLSTLVTMGFLLFNSACEDALTFSFVADYPIDFNIDIHDGTKATSFPFSDSGTLSIEENEEVLKYIEKIKEIEILQVECTLTGIPSNEEIIELTFEVQNTVFSITINNLSENRTFILPIESSKLMALSTYFFDNQQITVSVNGVSSYAPMQLGLKLNFVSKIIAII
jgi:hypothetical protein